MPLSAAVSYRAAANASSSPDVNTTWTPASATLAANATETYHTGDLAPNDVDATSTVSAGLASIIFHDPGDVTLGPGPGKDGTVNLLLSNSPSWL